MTAPTPTSSRPPGPATVPVTTDVPALAELADVVARLVSQGLDEHTLTRRVRDELARLLAIGFELPAATTVPDPERYVMYPLHVAADGSFSIASAVWNVGQGTPVHGHETWGVVGIHDGVEVVKWVMALYKSAETGAEVRFPDESLETYVPVPAR